MIQRDAYSSLRDWKDNSRGKALLVDGARQVGKTFLVEEFARCEFEDYVKIDFVKDDVAAAALAVATDTRQVVETLALICGKPVVAGRTLVFFDEVQQADSIVSFSKYLVEDGRFPVVMSGSLLGIELSRVKSLPVGYLRRETLYPVSFSEFCRAQGVPESVADELQECFTKKKPVRQSIHDRLIRLVRLYLVVGGMPEAVQGYIDSGGDLGALRRMLEEIVTLYGDDIMKHAGSRALQVRAIYDALPAQLDKENKRFQMQAVKNKGRYERYANDFAWLVAANAALKALNVTDPRPMLERSEEQTRFKLYASDVGMLMSCYRSNVALAAIAGARNVNFGGVYENFVAQELAAARVSLHYYHNSRKGEVDFLIETDAGFVLPIEVKSGKDYKRHVALNNLLSADEYGIERAYVLSEANVSVERREGGTVFYLPLYMAPLVAREAHGSGLAGTFAPPPTW